MNEEVYTKARMLLKSLKAKDGNLEGIEEALKILKREFPEEVAKAKEIHFDIDDCFEGRAFRPKALGDVLMQETPYKTVIGNTETYYYSNGVYVKNGTEHIKEQTAIYLGEKFTKQRATEVLSWIQANTFVMPEAIDNGWLNLENGLLNPETGEFRDHTPEIFSIARIPIIYDKEADCPKFKEELDGKLQTSTITDTQEMFGYCLMPGQRYGKAFLLYGPRRTMKSTILMLLFKMLGGSPNVSSIPLQTLENDKFSPAYLFGKMANICADLSSSELASTGTFLKITDGDQIHAGKKHQHPIDFSPSAKLIFSCNAIPPTFNKNLAFYRRWILLPYKKQHDVVDSAMRDKLMEELPGILNWALEGLKRIRENDTLSNTMSDEDIKDLWERHSDTIQSFIYNEISTEFDEAKITKREVYKAYIEYCQRIHATPQNVIKFGKWFIAHTGCGTTRIKDIPAYTGVSFKTDIRNQQDLNEFGGDV